MIQPLGRAAFMAWDFACWFLAIVIVALLRYISVPPEDYLGGVLVYAAVALAMMVAISYAVRGRYRVASFEQFIAIGVGVAFTGVTSALISGLAATLAFESSGMPVMLWFVVPPLAASGMYMARAAVRMRRQHRHDANGGDEPERLLIVGAGNMGEQVSRLVRTAPNSPYRVVGFLDDEPLKSQLSIGGARVIGTTRDLESAVLRTGAGHVVIAFASATSSFYAELAKRCRTIGVELMALPPIAEMLGRPVSLQDMRKVTVESVLGRRQVQTNLAEVSGLVANRRVLVTGAGGSIGAEIARQVHNLGPGELVLLDRDESALHGIQLDIYNKGLLDTRDMVLCDIRDQDALEAVFDEHRPEIVFHAAALKHLPMLELYPEEAWKTNVLGTRNLLELSKKYGVSKFVNISTDKAADPTTTLGRTKRIAEQMTASMANGSGGTYVSVRFGNVIGSRGSVLWTFRHQIDHGGPVTITHPEVERFVMTIPEACHLVIQAGAIGDPGEVMVLDMGKPVKILDIAERLIAESGEDVEIVFTGLRPGEKLTEVLIGENEAGHRPRHPLISHIDVPPVDLGQVDDHHANAVALDRVLST
ncbi:MAG TPA: nucleoside-diphosphate sugar epimerase/dehydratase [Actinomycetaceae bacterium]|nr:nucleoside-diphosphate sugar epimerase/dehydratase [Actinomycetaceae bacterium]